jgi:hypothetical protein
MNLYLGPNLHSNFNNRCLKWIASVDLDLAILIYRNTDDFVLDAIFSNRTEIRIKSYGFYFSKSR